MYPKYHIIYGFLFSIFIYFIINLNFLEFLILFLSCFLFDVDHYINYVFSEKGLSLKKAYKWNVVKGLKWRNLQYNEKKKHKISFFMFHGIEFLILLFFLSFFNFLFFYVFLGVLFHMFLDYIDIYVSNDLWYSKFSEIYILVRNKNKKELV